MTIDRRRRRLLAAGGTAAVAGLSGCTSVTPFVGKRLEETRTFDFEPESAVAVNADNGDVTVRSGDGDAVELTVVKKASSVFADLSDVSVDATRDGDTVRVETRRENGSWFGGTPSVDVTVELPDEATISEARTENGDVELRGVTGDVTITSENGDVTARNVDGFLTAETVNGDVDVRGVTGVDGARSINGSLDVDIPAIRRDVTVETRNGDVEASLSPNVDARVVLESKVGDASLSGPFDASTRTESYVEGRQGSGDNELRFATTNGDVTVSALD